MFALLHITVLAISLLLATSAQAEVVVDSTRLIGWQGCSPAQQRQINDAWSEAMKIAYRVSAGWFSDPIDFDNGVAENDYFGPSLLNRKSQADIKAVLSNAYTFQRAWPINPLSWQINARCDDWLSEPSSRLRFCSKIAAAAYTSNPGQSTKIPVINFCPAFFDKLNTCSEVLSRWGGSSRKDYKLDLQNYQCRGYAFLHELFHIDRLSKAGKQGHIKDLRIQYLDTSYMPPEKRTTFAYGPLFTKVLARYLGTNVGRFVSTNADNLAQFSLAKWVQDSLADNSYPALPRPNFKPSGDPYFTLVNGLSAVNGTDLETIIKGPICKSLDDFATTCTDKESFNSNDCTSEDPIIFTGFSDLTPSMQTSENSWDSQDHDIWQDFDTSRYSLPADPYLECYKGVDRPLDAQPSVPQSFMAPLIVRFCNQTSAEMTALDLSRSRYVSYPIPSTDGWTVYLGMQWNTGDPSCVFSRKFDYHECNYQLSVVLNGCDTDSITHKYGGSRVNHCVVWSMAINGTGPDIGEPGTVFSCIRSTEDVQQCDCTDGEVYAIDFEGACGYTSPPF